MIAIDEGKWEEFVTDNDLLTIKKKEDRKEGARLELELFWQTFLLSACRPDVYRAGGGYGETYSRRYKYIV